jgi:peptidoglycan/LPS O-acetylase OafA/YrhL
VCKLCLYSTVSQRLRGLSGVLLPALWLGALVAAIALRRRGPAERALPAALALLSVLAAMSMAVALVGEGEFEIVKHLYLTSLANALLAVLAVHATGLLSVGRRSRPSVPVGDADHETVTTA